MGYVVYVLLSLRIKKTYVGFTDNLERRLEEHNTGKSYYTKRYMPWKVIYREDYKTLVQARVREKYLKSSSGRRLVIRRLFDNI